MESIVIDTPEGIAHYQMASCIARLRLEVESGMGFRVSTLKAVKALYGCPKQTKKGALEWLEALYEKTYGFAYGAR
jgi:hypothetical protein